MGRGGVGVLSTRRRSREPDPVVAPLGLQTAVHTCLSFVNRPSLKSCTLPPSQQIPYVFSAICLVGVAWSSDRHHERTAHVAIPWLLGAIVLACFGTVAKHSVAGGFVMLTLAMGLVFGGQSTLATRAAGTASPSHAAMSLG